MEEVYSHYWAPYDWTHHGFELSQMFTGGRLPLHQFKACYNYSCVRSQHAIQLEPELAMEVAGRVTTHTCGGCGDKAMVNCTVVPIEPPARPQRMELLTCADPLY